MEIPVSLDDLTRTAPLTLVAAVALLIIIVESLKDESEAVTWWLGVLGLSGACLASVLSLDATGTAYVGMVSVGGFAAFFCALFSLTGILTLMLSRSYLPKAGIDHGEFTALVVLAVLGMMVMASAADLVVLFLGIELMSICFYILAGFARGRILSNEAALKYFLLGAFATGFLLYGIALVYGSTGSTGIAGLMARSAQLGDSPLLVIGLALLLIGLAFKVAAVPFHMWVPDVYEGAPTTVSGFMSTGGKAAAFAALLLVFSPAVIRDLPSLRDVVAVLAMLSMILGNILAISQSSVKRMLAYSSIAHAGYILVGVVAGNSAGATGVLFYLTAYTVMNLGAFGILAVGESGEGKLVAYDDYAGLSTRRPLMAGLMALFMFSLTGIPPFAGFFGKYYVFAGAVEAGMTWLAVVGVVMSVVSAYYYLRLVVMMYFREQQPAVDAAFSPAALAALVVAAAGLLGFGLYPSSVLNLTQHFF